MNIDRISEKNSMRVDILLASMNPDVFGQPKAVLTWPKQCIKRSGCLITHDLRVE